MIDERSLSIIASVMSHLPASAAALTRLSTPSDK